MNVKVSKVGIYLQGSKGSVTPKWKIRFAFQFENCVEVLNIICTLKLTRQNHKHRFVIGSLCHYALLLPVYTSTHMLSVRQWSHDIHMCWYNRGFCEQRSFWFLNDNSLDVARSDELSVQMSLPFCLVRPPSVGVRGSSCQSPWGHWSRGIQPKHRAFEHAQSLLSCFPTPSQFEQRIEKIVSRDAGSFPTSGPEPRPRRGGGVEESWSCTQPDLRIALEHQKNTDAPRAFGGIRKPLSFCTPPPPLTPPLLSFFFK